MDDGGCCDAAGNGAAAGSGKMSGTVAYKLRRASSRVAMLSLVGTPLRVKPYRPLYPDICLGAGTGANSWICRLVLI